LVCVVRALRTSNSRSNLTSIDALLKGWAPSASSSFTTLTASDEGITTAIFTLLSNQSFKSSCVSLKRFKFIVTGIKILLKIENQLFIRSLHLLKSLINLFIQSTVLAVESIDHLVDL